MRNIKNYEGFYAITKDGKVWSHYNNKFLQTPPTKSGYFRLTLCSDKKRMNKFVHRLVAEAYISNPDNKPYINHIDSDKTNNIVDNLEWCTYEENMTHSREFGVNTSKRLSIDEASEICEAYDTGLFLQRELAGCFNVCRHTIWSIVNGTWKHA